MKRVDLAGLAMEGASGAPIVLLRERDAPHRLLPIFIGGVEAAAIAVAVGGVTPPRPLTHDLMAEMIRSLHVELDAVEITDLAEGAFLARIAMHGPLGEHRLDTRPSDAIALAVRLGAPLFVSEAVLDEAGASVLGDLEGPDEASIDAAVDEFRAFLDDLDPAEFLTDTGGSVHPPTAAQPGDDDGGTGDGDEPGDAPGPAV
ncbi:MAG: bifunctional nuclease family protein [Acidimicrobiales bacterium]